MDEIDDMVTALSFALSEMMTDDGPIPGSVLDKILSSDEAEASVAILVFTSELLGVTLAIADEVIDRLGKLGDIDHLD